MVGLIFHEMIQSLRLLVPAIIPSWRFFESIAPSPRIEYAALNTKDETPLNWQPYRPRPEYISFASMVKRLFWNPRWNERLFASSCAERLAINPSAHSADEIAHRIRIDLSYEDSEINFFAYRLVFISRADNSLERENHVIYSSSIYEVTP